jgi:hypothetical protein
MNTGTGTETASQHPGILTSGYFRILAAADDTVRLVAHAATPLGMSECSVPPAVIPPR